MTIVFTQQTLAQGPPPPIAEPTDENKVLIDQLIEVSRYKEYFQMVCIHKINEASKKENWSAEKKAEIIKSINFKHFDFTIYNSFAHDSKEELQAKIKAAEQVQKKGENNLNHAPISNFIMEKNLESYLGSLIKGVYVVTSKKKDE